MESRQDFFKAENNIEECSRKYFTCKYFDPHGKAPDEINLSDWFNQRRLLSVDYLKESNPNTRKIIKAMIVDVNSKIKELLYL